MNYVFPRPGERIIEAPRPGETISRAGDRRRREAALAARRAEAEARAADPDVQEREDERAARAHRDRLLGAVNDALCRHERLLGERSRLEVLLEQIDAKVLRTGLADTNATALSDRIKQVERVIERAELEVATARACLLHFEVTQAERAAAREVERVAAEADAERRARAEEAARVAYDAVMRESNDPAAPKVTRKAGT